MIREGPLMRGLAWVQSAVAGVGGGQALDLRTEPTTIETQGCSPVSVCVSTCGISLGSAKRLHSLILAGRTCLRLSSCQLFGMSLW